MKGGKPGIAGAACGALAAPDGSLVLDSVVGKELAAAPVS